MSEQVKTTVLTLGEIVVKFEMPQNFIDEINKLQSASIDLCWKASSITCLLYTSPSPRDGIGSRMPSSA